jgi:type I restriction enzyme S subunit
LPHPAEQRRIVAEIEKQFARLDEANRATQKALRQLDRSANSLFASAITGFGSDPTNLMSEANWLSDIAPSHWSKTAPDSEAGITPPTGWAIASLDQLTTRITSGSRDWSPHYGRGSGTFVLAQNVRPRKLDMSTRQLVDPPRDESSRTRSAIEHGDLLVTIVGANTGDVCPVETALEEHYVCQSVALLRPITTDLTKYLSYYLSDHFYGQAIWRKYTYGAGRPHLSFEQLSKTPILVPPNDEMQMLTARIESLETLISNTRSAVSTAYARAERLRQSILAKAFSGQLVPQDPDDEPESMTLARISEQRGKADHTPARTQRRKRAPAESK